MSQVIVKIDNDQQPSLSIDGENIHLTDDQKSEIKMRFGMIPRVGDPIDIIVKVPRWEKLPDVLVMEK